MEETLFIKCEPAWYEECSESEQSSVDNLSEVKLDPNAIFDGSCEDVKSTLVIKDESEIPVVSLEDCDAGGVLLNECHSLNSSLLIKLAVGEVKDSEALSSKMDPPTLILVDNNSQGESPQIEHGTVFQSSATTDSEERYCACGEIFTSCRHLKCNLLKPAGVKSSASTVKKPFICHFCERTYNYKSDFDVHMRTHTGHKPHICTTCGKAFSKSSNMKKHMLLHTGDRPYSCQFCSKGFTDRGHLNEHLLVHTGEKPHSCSVCGKTFTQKSSLRNHSLLHSDQKPYKCNICNKAFVNKTRIERHMLSHTGVKTHSCSLCSKIFAYRSDLNKHMKKHFSDCISSIGVHMLENKG